MAPVPIACSDQVFEFVGERGAGLFDDLEDKSKYSPLLRQLALGEIVDVIHVDVSMLYVLGWARGQWSCVLGSHCRLARPVRHC